MLLDGKVAIVTGGSRGIGRSIVKKYLENGAKVILWGSRAESETQLRLFSLWQTSSQEHIQPSERFCSPFS